MCLLFWFVLSYNTVVNPALVQQLTVSAKLCAMFGCCSWFFVFYCMAACCSVVCMNLWSLRVTVISTTMMIITVAREWPRLR